MVSSISELSRNIDLSFKKTHSDIKDMRKRKDMIVKSIEKLKTRRKELFDEVSKINKMVDSSLDKSSPTKEKKEIVGEGNKKKNSKKKLDFYDVKARKRFSSTDYEEVTKNSTLFAVAKSPHGNHECYRILKKVK